MRFILTACLGLTFASPVLPQNPEELNFDPSDIPWLIGELDDDDVRWNAMESMRALVHLGEPAIPALEKALDSKDYQQRQCAAAVLRTILSSRERSPSDRLLEVTVEGLRDDSLHVLSCMSNAAQGREFLPPYVHRAKPYLQASLRSPDRQLRFTSAYLLASAGIVDEIETTAAILIDHLADNDIPGDAVLACFALHKLGEAVIPFLEAQRDTDDPQQSDAIELIILDIEDPPRNEAELRERKDLHSLTKVVFDPCLQGRYCWSSLGDREKWSHFWAAWNDEVSVPSLDDLWERHDGRLEFKIDAKELEFMVVAIGFVDDVFDRRLTLRVHRNGTIERRELDSEGHERWWIEYRPEPP